MQINISKQEWKSTIILSFMVVLIASIPYIYGYFTAPQGAFYTGIHTVNMGDTYSYLSWQEQAREGHILFKELYAVESQSAVIFHPLFLIMGWVGWLTGLSNIFVFHIFRVILGFIFLIVVYRFISRFFSDPMWRKVCFYIILFGAGFGWIVSGQVSSFDLWASELIPFLSIYESPLNLLSLILIIFSFQNILLYFSDDKKYRLVILGGILLLLSFIHPYDIITIGFSYIAYWIAIYLFKKNLHLLWHGLKGGLIVLFITLPGLIYLYIIFHNPVIHSWIESNVRLSMSVWNYFYGLGIWLPLAIIGFSVELIRNRSKENLLLFAWLAITGVLLFQPFFLFQRKLSLGLFVPLSIFATYGLLHVKELFNLQSRELLNRLLIILLIVISSGSLVVIMVNDVVVYSTNQVPYYLPQGYFEAGQYIKQSTEKDAVLLSSFWPSNILPSLTGHPVFYGHGDQTPNVAIKSEEQNEFFKGNDINWKGQFLKKYRISYIVFGDVEKQIGYKDPSGIPFIKPVYTKGGTTVYKVMMD